MGDITLEDFTQSVDDRQILGLGEERGREQGLNTGELETTLRLPQRRCAGLTPARRLASALSLCLSWKHQLRRCEMSTNVLPVWRPGWRRVEAMALRRKRWPNGSHPFRRAGL
jgi:hypothetical protein